MVKSCMDVLYQKNPSLRFVAYRRYGLFSADDQPTTLEELYTKVTVPTRDRLFQVAMALKLGSTVDTLYKLTGIDPWFLEQMDELVRAELELERLGAIA